MMEMPLVFIKRMETGWKIAIISAAVTIVAALLIRTYGLNLNTFFGLSWLANILLTILIGVEASVPFLSVGLRTKTAIANKDVLTSKIIALR